MQHIISTTLATLLLSTLAFKCLAAPAVAEIPDKVRADILKRHPTAQDFQAAYETHYQRRLLEVSFKEEANDNPTLELFREDGKLFTNELPLFDLTEAPQAVKDSLETNFPSYQLKKAELIVNPNGVGEEYEVYMLVGGANWKISVNEKGKIQEKQPF
jgi:hypothetical protein